MLIKSMDVLIGFIFFTFWTLVVSTLHKTFLFFWTKWNDRLLKTGRDWWLGIASPRYLLRRVSSNQSHYTKAKRTLGNSPVNYLGLYVVSFYTNTTQFGRSNSPSYTISKWIAINYYLYFSALVWNENILVWHFWN